ncbi:MAG TPA: serine/threonine-protein kinase [Kofleriaceae bacterium]|nr:serine/threonine-protein kinase [Kofleriaceae bacterium]
MGAVYAAEDLARTERVAIKLAHSEHIAAELIATHMARELRAGRATNHPNVVTVLDGGCEAGRSYVVMELASGRSLGTLAAEGLSIRRVGAIVDQILAGLDAIHRAGYLHGDVKTDNILVTREQDGSELAKIIDLGLACEQGSARVDDEHVISGTPQYLAPEIALGGAKTVASELYAVGVILYELLTGTPPFSGGAIFEILRKHVEDEVMPPSLRSPELRLSIALERVVLRALHKEPGARFASAAEFRAALRAATSVSLDAATASSAFSTTSPTLEWTRLELPPRPRALGTSPVPAPCGRDPVVIVEAALDATRTHLAAHRLSAARDELEAALRLLDDDASGDRVAWRLLLALSAVSDRLRDPVRARRIARLALDSAARAGSEIGRRRAKSLIERFAGRTRLCA